jgi:hypothetical protein
MPSDEPQASQAAGEERSLGRRAVAFLASNATGLSVAGAFLGSVVYVLLTWVASWVYEPAGVRPSEVGLGYGAMLLGTAVTLVVALGVVLVTVAIAFGAAWLRRKKNKALFLLSLFAILALVLLVVASWPVDDVAGFFLVPLPAAVAVANIVPEHAYKVIAIFATILALVVVGVSVWNTASAARRDIQDGVSGARLSDYSIAHGKDGSHWSAGPMRRHPVFAVRSIWARRTASACSL